MTLYRRFVRFLADYEIALEVRKALDFGRLSADARVAAVHMDMLVLQAQLAAAELSRAQAGQLAYTATVQLEMAEKIAFARGEMAGQERMAEAVLESVRERMEGAVDLVQEQDVAAAKKGMIH